ncbi:hypothetical protein DL96DRAFT_1810196 [Flagelloscypha sp. PMI_526]|nr:hypothetical protein DL96DRAFT_1810196 [Flagelloscypha sp. PMI_526]
MSFLDLHDHKSTAFKKAKKQHFNSIKARDSNVEADWTPFRAAEKKYKAKFPPPNLDAVLDLALLDPTGPLKSLKNPPVYILPAIPGLVVLPRFLDETKQKEVSVWALEYQVKLNETNLHTHYIMPESGLWQAYLQGLQDPAKDVVVCPRASSSPVSPPVLDSGPRQLINNEPASVSSISLESPPKPPAAPSPTLQPTPVTSLIKKLRWANIGWFYHWGTKQYDFARGKAPIHHLIRDVCQRAVADVNWGEVYSNSSEDESPKWDEWKTEYEPDAGIVNFYHTKDTLMAHVDRSEVCETEPLVSISLGQAAIFLIGDNSRDTEPIPILLRSGDVVIMSGPCRRAYHGKCLSPLPCLRVPRILDGTCPLQPDNNDSGWTPYAEYLASTRINVNVRQVFPKGFRPFSQQGDISAQ